ncbi:arylsulfatase (predicted) [Zalerion maritima]|uniref:Arylsulfatase (Predicted) n=1 Tax=Zalerion maritima TaxID=339359 RepID=A0AAD5WR86_9PEZI|nr:arylsulfatase (predicted) [Zalerion maritima]
MPGNGAEGQVFEALSVMQKHPFVVTEKFYNNALENIGDHDNFVCTVIDILPAVIDLAAVKHPGTNFRGRELVKPRGLCWVDFCGAKTDKFETANIVG